MLMMKALVAIHAEKRRTLRDPIATTHPVPSMKRIVVTALTINRTTNQQASFSEWCHALAAWTARQNRRKRDNWQKPSNGMHQESSGNQQMALFSLSVLHNLSSDSRF